jgi:hypothetical protein
MSDMNTKEQLQDALATVHAEQPPAFADVWAAAERQYERSRKRYAGIVGIAAAIVLAVSAFSIWSANEADMADDFLIADALMNSTQWSAPSDLLMPEHQFDIYQDIPFLMESTNTQEGSLL